MDSTGDSRLLQDWRLLHESAGQDPLTRAAALLAACSDFDQMLRAYLNDHGVDPSDQTFSQRIKEVDCLDSIREELHRARRLRNRFADEGVLPDLVDARTAVLGLALAAHELQGMSWARPSYDSVPQYVDHDERYCTLTDGATLAIPAAGSVDPDIRCAALLLASSILDAQIAVLIERRCPGWKADRKDRIAYAIGTSHITSRDFIVEYDAAVEARSFAAHEGDAPDPEQNIVLVKLFLTAASEVADRLNRDDGDPAEQAVEDEDVLPTVNVAATNHRAGSGQAKYPTDAFVETASVSRPTVEGWHEGFVRSVALLSMVYIVALVTVVLTAGSSTYGYAFQHFLQTHGAGVHCSPATPCRWDDIDYSRTPHFVVWIDVAFWFCFFLLKWLLLIVVGVVIGVVGVPVVSFIIAHVVARRLSRLTEKESLNRFWAPFIAAVVTSGLIVNEHESFTRKVVGLVLSNVAGDSGSTPVPPSTPKVVDVIASLKRGQHRLTPVIWQSLLRQHGFGRYFSGSSPTCAVVLDDGGFDQHGGLELMCEDDLDAGKTRSGEPCVDVSNCPLEKKW